MKQDTREYQNEEPMSKIEAKPTELMWKSKNRAELDDAIERREISDKKLVKPSLLITDVPSNLKEKYAEHIAQSQKTSVAKETWKRLNIRGYAIDREKDTRKKFYEDWWNTTELIAVAEKSIKVENKEKRKQKIKDFFFIVSGLRFLKRVKYDRQQKQGLNSMVKDFLNYVPLKEYIRNDREPLSVNMYNFIYYIIVYKQWRLVLFPEANYNILHKFKEQYKDEDSVLEHSPLTKKLLKDLYYFFKEND